MRRPQARAGRARRRGAEWLLRSALALLLPGAAAACRPDLSGPEIPEGVTFLELTGDWKYVASDLRRAGSGPESSCKIEGAVLHLEKIENAGAFTGSSSGGALTCTGELGFLSGPLTPYPIENGYTFNQFVAFDYGSPDWRHDGLVSTSDATNIDSMSGTFTLRTEGVVFEGKFRLDRAAAR